MLVLQKGIYICGTVDGRNLAPPAMFKNPVNNGINYQPQLVSRISAINSRKEKRCLHPSKPFTLSRAPEVILGSAYDQKIDLWLGNSGIWSKMLRSGRFQVFFLEFFGKCLQLDSGNLT